MSDPKYLTDDGADATDFERELLQAAQEVGLSAQEKQAIWASVALQALPAAPLNPTAAPSIAPGGAAAKAGASLSPLLKGLLVLLGLGGISAGIYELRRAPAGAPSPPPNAVVKAAAAPASAAAASPSDSATPSLATAAESAPSSASAPSASVAVHDASPVESKSALREESVAVLEIRRTLRAGDAAGALHLLDQARQRFPHGALSQEREALSIEALAKSGSHDAAARQADAFLRAHPKSPYAADVQTFKSH
jgi:hypothetical protein